MTVKDILKKVAAIARRSGDKLEPEEALALLRSYERMALSCAQFPMEDDELAQFATGARILWWLEQEEGRVGPKRTKRGRTAATGRRGRRAGDT